jgi:cell volume regulation protein A
MRPEPHATEVVLLAIGVLLLASVLAGRFSGRFGIPVILLFLGLGMLAGSEGIGRISFEDYRLSYRVGTCGLVLILFDGGLRTPLSAVRRAIAPAGLLATVGVGLTAGIVGLGARLLGFPWKEGLLMGSIVASTDAAAVFSAFRGGGIRLHEKPGAVLEVESGLNDPMAVLLTVTITNSIIGRESIGAQVALVLVLQLTIGAVVGLVIGLGASMLIRRLLLRGGGLYPLLTTAIAFVTYGGASLVHGSGFLAVYAAAVVLANGPLPYRNVLLRAHDFVAWASQIVMFLVVGLLVFPSRLAGVAPVGLAIAMLLVLVARPIAVAGCLVPFGYSRREVLFLGWAGLRGAVPIILAIIPILANAPAAHAIFNIVFFVVLVSTLLQGGSTRWLARRLGLASREPSVPDALLEISSRRPLDFELMSFHIDPASAVSGARVSEVPFPDNSSVMLVVRAATLIAPRGDTVLSEGDHVYLFCRRADAGTVRLLFGREDEG